MADEVGSGQVAIEPTFVGFRSKVSNEVETSGREGGRTFGSAFKGALVGLGALIGLDKLKDTFTASIQGAGNLEQSVGGVQAVFKDGADQVFGFAASAKTALGLTKNEYNELGTLIGAQLKNGGTAMDQLAPKTQELISLGGDLSAQFGGSTADSVAALSSALKGERDPIERYGVSLSQVKIDAEAAALGFKKVDGALSSEASQAATLSLIMKQTADAHGAAARETATFASKQSTFNAIMKEGKAQVAGAFLPAAAALYGFMNDRLPGAFDKATVRATTFATNLTAFVSKLVAFQAGIASGAMTPDLVKALGLDPSSGFGKFLGQAIGGIRAFQAAFEAADGDITSSGFAGFMEVAGYRTRLVLDELKGGIRAFQAAFEAADGDITSSGFAGFMEVVGYRVRLVFDKIKEGAGGMFEAMKTGDFSQLSTVWDSFIAIARPAGPILVEVGKAVGDMSTEIGKMIAGALPLLKPLLEGAANVMQFLADNTGVLTAVIIALAAGMVVYRLGQIAANIAALASVPVAAAQAASNFALAGAIRAQTAATATNTVATSTGTGSRLAAMASMVATGVALAASKAAQLAGAAATGIATAAQWAWNAAMTANPIGLIILAVVALVAGLVWFFTQTELGREIVANVFNFIQSVVQNVINWFTGTLVPTFLAVWANIQAGLALVGAFFSSVWSNTVNGVSGFIGNLVQFFLDLPGKIMEALGNMGTFLLDAGKALIQGFIDGISGMVGAIGDAVGGVLDFAKSFFPHSPAKRGPFSGSGYTTHSGKALTSDFAKSIESEQGAVARAASKIMTAASLTGQVTTTGTAGAAAAGGWQGGGAQVKVDMHMRDGLTATDVARAFDNRLNYKMRRASA